MNKNNTKKLTLSKTTLKGLKVGVTAGQEPPLYSNGRRCGTATC